MEGLIKWLSRIPLCLQNYSPQILAALQALSLHKNMQSYIRNSVEAFAVSYNRAEFTAMSPIFYLDPEVFVQNFGFPGDDDPWRPESYSGKVQPKIKYR